ncbi:MAG: tetratricopeptide repeat protein [Candidatus Eremiobacteraeota bacterium]|nr:tetratricopeptide repeat protein [Candidatus Eremiobacteraeota bacterium]
MLRPIALVFALLASFGGTAAMAGQAAVSAPNVSAAQMKTDFYSAVSKKAYTQALEIGKRYLDVQPHDDAFALDYAYALLAAGKSQEALPLLKRLSASSNADVASAALKQLKVQDASPADSGATVDTTLQQAYDESGRGHHAAAAALLRTYLAAKPSDEQARLQLAYELEAVGNRAEAAQEFGALTSSTNAEIASKAKAGLVPAQGAGADAPRGSVYGYIIHDSRFADTFYGADATYVLAHSRIEPYIVAHYSSDTRSGAPGASDVFNDNALVLNGGLRTALGTHASAFIEGGLSQGLRGQRSISDFRTGVTYFAQFGAPKTAMTTINASAVEYSRFSGNAIFYGNVLHEVPLGAHLRAVAGFNTALDIHRDYFNNFGELLGGVEAISGPVTLRVVRVYGTYFTRGASRPAAPDYQSTRAELIFGFTFR